VDGDSQISWDTATGQCKVAAGGGLTKYDEDGRSLEVKAVTDGDSWECATDFDKADEIEWRYRLSDGDTMLGEVVLSHFNVEREKAKNSDNPTVIKLISFNGTDSVPSDLKLKLLIDAPYANKTYRGDGETTDGDIVLKMSNDDAADTYESLKLQ
jgi:hypothetical protein